MQEEKNIETSAEVEEPKKKKKKKKSGGGFIRWLIILIALGVLGYSGWELYKIMNQYHQADVTYESVNRDYTVKKAKSVDTAETPDIWPKYEDAEVPLDIDWESLKSVNKDIVAWVYMEGIESVSYPVCWREGDDDYYLHRSYEGDYLYAGSIFLEGLNNPDFADPVSIVYGHNMKNGSMFAQIKSYKDQETYDKNPYFWILTPNGNYRYHIFSSYLTSPGSDVYQLFARRGQKMLDWEEKIREYSEIKSDLPLYKDDSVVVLSTCESDHVHRNVVVGRCVSTIQPIRTEDYVSAGTKGNTLEDIDKYEASIGLETVSSSENNGYISAQEPDTTQIETDTYNTDDNVWR